MINADSEGVEIYIDDKFVGDAPAKLTLARQPRRGCESSWPHGMEAHDRDLEGPPGYTETVLNRTR